MTHVFLIQHQLAPWNWQVSNSGIAAGALSRRFVTLFGGLDLEAEFGIGQRFGDRHATELWTGLVVRRTEFPWNNLVKTTVAVMDGFDYATRFDMLDSYEYHRLRFRDVRVGKPKTSLDDEDWYWLNPATVFLLSENAERQR